ncbi:MAG: M48 family metalloprotease [Magnetococcus sp. YQC-5]
MKQTLPSKIIALLLAGLWSIQSQTGWSAPVPETTGQSGASRQTNPMSHPIGEDVERVLGESISLEIFSRYGGLYQNEALTRYVTLVGKTLAEVTDRPALEYRFAILNSQEEHAFAAPGGFVFVTLGLLQTLRNEAELAGILGHELAHINRKHLLNSWQRLSGDSTPPPFTMAGITQNPNLLEPAIEQMADMLFTRGMDKRLEHEADLDGLEYALRAGYHPAGLHYYLQRLARVQGSIPSVFFTTHPPSTERIQQMIGRLDKQPDTDRLALLAERFKRNLPSQ